MLAIEKTRIGKIIRALAINPQMVGALGINTTVLYAAVFGIGSVLAGVAGALAAPTRTLTPGMGLSILIESFIVTVIGGRALSFGAPHRRAAYRAYPALFGAIGFPLFVDGHHVRPYGSRSDGQTQWLAWSGACTMTRPSFLQDTLVAIVALIIPFALPLFSKHRRCATSLIYVMAYGLFAMSLNLLVGLTGLVLVRARGILCVGCLYLRATHEDRGSISFLSPFWRPWLTLPCWRW